MALTPGSRVGPHEIVSPLGEGGMGVVYRARDRKLDRDVAIKVLPEIFASDPDRVARFEREARTLAQLNHPNIASIYGFEESGDAKALVLELVEGPTLADRILQGRLPFDEATAIAKQIADALTAAHEAGIVHRDLKPANVKLRPDGTVKVLDFGLAKALGPDGAAGRSSSVSMSPTLTTPAMTAVGMIMGTAAYMAPEQAKGRAVDKRADVWALGCVLFEMLTGKRPFEGDDMSDVLATVLKSEPDWASIPAAVPAPVQTVIRRCLEKDPRKRVADASVIRFVLDEPLSTADVRRSSGRGWAGWMWLAGGAAAASALVAATVWSTTRTPGPIGEPYRFAVVPLESQPLAAQGSDRDLAVSPDGRRIVYRAAIAAGSSGFKLVVRDLIQGSDRVLDGTDFARCPFISADGQWVGFFEGSVLKKVPIAGGLQSTVAALGANPRGATWMGDTIIVATADPATGLLSVPASGGTPTVITQPDQKLGEGDHVAPSFLPGGDRLLFSVVSVAPEPDIAILDLKTRQRKTILRGGRMPQYVAPGMLVFGGPGVLKAARFDLARGDVVSEVVPVVERVATPSEYAANYDVAGNGMLVYIAGIDTVGTGAQRSLVWVTPDGREEPLRLDARAFVDPRIGIDDRQVVVELNDAPDDVWTVDVTRGALTRQTFEEGEDETPAWMPDGKTLVYASTRTGVSRAVFRRRSDGGGTEEQLWSGNEHVHVETPTPDGKSLILSASASNGGQTDLMLLPLETKRDWQPLLQTRFNEFGARLSPDGRWMAYTSDESGRLEVYVRAFPTLENKVQVSTTGGQEPIWSRRGDAVYFRSNEGVMAASVRVQGSTVSVGQSRKLFDNKYFLKGGSHTGYDVARDGRFLMVKAGTVLDGNVLVRPVLNVVLNWPTELESRIK